MTRPRRFRERNVKERAFRKEVHTHKTLLYILTVLGFLFLVYEFATGSLSLQLFAGVIFALVFVAFVGDVIHKRNVKMLKLVLAVFAGTFFVFAFGATPLAVHAYTLTTGGTGSLTASVTSSNGEITAPIPYVTPPSTNFASTQFIGDIPLVCGGTTGTACPDFNANPLGWFGDQLVNLLIDVVNALLYVLNILIGFLVAIVAGLISIPVYLFDAISITTLGPIVDFLSFVPPVYAWLVTGVVWAISLAEWVVIVIAAVRLTRVAISSVSEVVGQEEEGLKEDTGELA